MKELHRRTNRGMTLIELAVVMTIIAILAAVLTPMVSNYVGEARVTAATAEVRSIADAIARFEKDLGRFPMFTAGSGLLQDTSADVLRLEGPGNMPSETVATSWTGGVTDSDCSGGCSGSALAGQLLFNSPGYATTSSMAKPFKWKGPYIDSQSDPWGNKYLVNIINAKSSSADASFVLSAGPDGVVQTAFNLPKTSSVAASGDDIISRIK